jgi:hypothetical protein
MRHKDPRESDMVRCYTGATRPAAFLLVCLSLSVPAWAAPSDNPVEQRDGPPCNRAVRRCLNAYLPATAAETSGSRLPVDGLITPSTHQPGRSLVQLYLI